MYKYTNNKKTNLNYCLLKLIHTNEFTNAFKYYSTTPYMSYYNIQKSS